MPRPEFMELIKQPGWLKVSDVGLQSLGFGVWGLGFVACMCYILNVA